MTVIEDVRIRKILDSRGNPTVEVDILTSGGFGSFAAPSGASTGMHEVDAFPKKGVDESVSAFRRIAAPTLVGMDALDQRGIDEILKEVDGTKKLSRIGGNAIVAASIATAKAASHVVGLPLCLYLGGRFSEGFPFPLGNVLGGGKHAIGGTTFQEFLVCAADPSPSKSVFANATVHKNVKNRLKKKFPKAAIGKGDEGAWVAKMKDEDALKLVSGACKDISNQVKFPIHPSLDIAASSFFSKGKYVYPHRKLTTKKQIDFVAELVKKYKLHIVEDPLDENDFEGYAELTEMVGDKCIIVGDDLFVTNKQRLAKGIKMGACNAILIKPNQIGTLSDTIDTIKLAHDSGYKTVVSHRSGETTDESIAHIAVAFGSYAIKTGAVGGERIAKLNELIRIEEVIKGAGID
jgi:enolase